jgi:hypothetical protein
LKTVEGAGYFQCGDSLRDDEYQTLEVEILTAGCCKFITISSSRTVNLSWIKDSVCKKEDTCDLGFH